MLESLGVKHLVAVAGSSYGGRLAFLWGVTYPKFKSELGHSASGPDWAKWAPKLKEFMEKISK